MAVIRPTWRAERALWREGWERVAGVDEVGRGPLAGPGVAGAVGLTTDEAARWEGAVTDSKRMTEADRGHVYEAMTAERVNYGVGACGPDEIDTLGIAAATRLAMARAIEALEPSPDFLLIDAVRLESLRLPQRSIIKGDAISVSIAAASVIAKVTRDRLMADVFDARFPAYGFASHKGYGTAAHLAALWQNGPCEIHRASFNPVRDALGAGVWSRGPGVSPAVETGATRTAGRA